MTPSTAEAKFTERRSVRLATEIAKVALAALLIVWLIRSGRLDPATLKKIFHTWPSTLLSLALIYTTIVLTSLRWELLLRAQNIVVRFRDCFTFSMVGLFLGLATPGATGADVAKAYFIDRHAEGRRAAALTTIVLDRIFGLLGLLLVAVVAMVLSPELMNRSASLRTVAYFFSAALVAGIVLLGLIFGMGDRFAAKIRPYAERIPGVPALANCAESASVYKNHRGLLLTASLLSPAAYFAALGALGILFRAQGYRMDAMDFTVASIIAFAVTVVPITPAAIGVGQLAFFSTFEAARAMGRAGSDACTAYQCLYIVMCVSGALFYLLPGMRRAKARTETT